MNALSFLIPVGGGLQTGTEVSFFLIAGWGRAASSTAEGCVRAPLHFNRRNITGIPAGVSRRPDRARKPAGTRRGDFPSSSNLDRVEKQSVLHEDGTSSSDLILLWTVGNQWSLFPCGNTSTSLNGCHSPSIPPAPRHVSAATKCHKYSLNELLSPAFLGLGGQE